MNPADLYPLLEKGGLLAGLLLAVHYLLRRLERSQAEMIGLMADTIERNTEALIKLDLIVSRCQGTAPAVPANAENSFRTRPKVLSTRHATESD